MRYKITQPATLLPMPLSVAKAHLRVEDDYEDDLIQSLIAAAAEHCEQVMMRAIMDKEITVVYDNGPVYKLPIVGVTSVTSAQDEDGNATTDFDLDEISNTVTAGDNVKLSRIVYRAGAVDSQDVPKPIIQAMLLLIGHWYENRSSVHIGGITKAIEYSTEALLHSYRSLSL